MRGQTSLEFLIFLAAVLTVATFLVHSSMGRSREELVLSGARAGLENAIAFLREQGGGEFAVERAQLSGRELYFRVRVRGASWTESEMENLLRAEALRFLCYTLTGSFPEEPKPVGGYDVRVEVERL